MKPAAAVGRRKPLALRVWRSPLARRADRAEAALTWSMLVIWLLALPILATIGSVQWSALQARAASEQGSVVAADAVLTQDARFDPVTYRSTPTGVTAEATWTGRDGRPATGPVDAVPGSRAGDHVVIWLNPAGAVVAAPMTTLDAAAQAGLMAAGGWLGLGLLLIGGWWIGRARLDRRRWQAWAQEWETFEPGRNSP
jgi:hypothetical protein